MKKYKFQFSRSACKQFSKLVTTVQRRIMQKLEEYESLDQPLKHAKKMQGLQNHFSFRIGDYRAICTKKGDSDIVILLVLKNRTQEGSI